MKKEPLVSILMATYNSEKYLEDSINSIFDGLYKNIEVIIVNDGSSDNSDKILSSLAKKRQCITILNKENSGLTKSLNIGLDKCQGKYIARIDADDLFISGKISKQVNYLENNQNVGILATNAFLIDKEGESTSTTKHHFASNEAVERALLNRNAYFFHSSWMVRKTLFNKLNGYDEFFVKAQDFDFLLRALRVTEIRCLTEPLIKFRLTSDSVSHDKEYLQFKYASVTLYRTLSLKAPHLYKAIAKEELFKQISLFFDEKKIASLFETTKKLSAIKQLFLARQYIKLLRESYVLAVNSPNFIFDYKDAVNIRRNFLKHFMDFQERD